MFFKVIACNLKNSIYKVNSPYNNLLKLHEKIHIKVCILPSRLHPWGKFRENVYNSPGAKKIGLHTELGIVLLRIVKLGIIKLGIVKIGIVK